MHGAPVKTQVVDEDMENQEKHKSVQIRIASNGESQEVVMIPYTTQSGQTEDGAEQGKFVVLEKGRGELAELGRRGQDKSTTRRSPPRPKSSRMRILSS